MLTDVDAVSSGTSVAGTIDHPAGRQVRVELFASGTCDGSGHGEGATPLGALTLTAPGGTAAFSAVVADAGGQRVITATATDLTTGLTSEFSRCAPTSAAPPDTDPPTPGPSPGPGSGAPPPGPGNSGPTPPIGLPTDDDPPRIVCEVPKLAGLTLAKATKRLKANGCAAGEVTKPKRRRGKGFRLVVKRTSLKPGTIRRKGTTVRLTLHYVRTEPRRR